MVLPMYLQYPHNQYLYLQPEPVNHQKTLFGVGILNLIIYDQQT